MTEETGDDEVERLSLQLKDQMARARRRLSRQSDKAFGGAADEPRSFQPPRRDKRLR